MILLENAASTFRASRAASGDAAPTPPRRSLRRFLQRALQPPRGEPARIRKTTAAIAHHGSGR
jgi:hypothetical protein